MVSASRADEIRVLAHDLGERIDEGDYRVGDDPRWGDRMRDLGFVMDCFHSFEDAYGTGYWEPDKLAGIVGGIDDLQLLGDAAFSVWRYINHWAMADTTDEFRVLRMLLARIEELTQGDEPSPTPAP